MNISVAARESPGREFTLISQSIYSPSATDLHVHPNNPMVSVAVRNDYGLLRFAPEEVHDDCLSAASNAVVLPPNANDVPQHINVVARQEVNQDVQAPELMRRSGTASSPITVSSTDEDSSAAGSDANALSSQKEKKSGLTVSSAITVSSNDCSMSFASNDASPTLLANDNAPAQITCNHAEALEYQPLIRSESETSLNMSLSFLDDIGSDNNSLYGGFSAITNMSWQDEGQMQHEQQKDDHEKMEEEDNQEQEEQEEEDDREQQEEEHQQVDWCAPHTVVTRCNGKFMLVVANAPIAEGDVVVPFTGVTMLDEEVPLLDNPVTEYITRDFVSESSSHGSTARFVAHSCDPNCRSMVLMQKETSHMLPYLVAIRDIKEGEELTRDYGFHCRSEKLKSDLTLCHCNSDNCRKNVYRKGSFDLSTKLGQDLLPKSPRNRMSADRFGGDFFHIRFDEMQHTAFCLPTTQKMCQCCNITRRNVNNRRGKFRCLQCNIDLCTDCWFGIWHVNAHCIATVTDAHGANTSYDMRVGEDRLKYMKAPSNQKLRSLIEKRVLIKDEDKWLSKLRKLCPQSKEKCVHAKVYSSGWYVVNPKPKCLICGKRGGISRCVECVVDLCEFCWYKWHVGIDPICQITFTRDGDEYQGDQYQEGE